MYLMGYASMGVCEEAQIHFPSKFFVVYFLIRVIVNQLFYFSYPVNLSSTQKLQKCTVTLFLFYFSIACTLWVMRVLILCPSLGICFPVFLSQKFRSLFFPTLQCAFVYYYYTFFYVILPVALLYPCVFSTMLHNCTLGILFLFMSSYYPTVT